jgi:hypothetical protein
MFIIEPFTRLVGFPIISIKPKSISDFIIWEKQLVGLGIILVAKVSSIDYSLEVIMNFCKGFVMA